MTVPGVGVRPGRDRTADIDSVAARHGGRVGLPGVLAGLHRRAGRSLAPGLRARRALWWDSEDRSTTRWWPQGVTSAGDAADPARTGSARLLVVAWYEKDGRGRTVGSRLSVLDLDERRYAHVRLARVAVADDGVARLAPLPVHAGGLAWRGGWLHVAATLRGFWSCHWDDVLAGPGGDLVLPVRLGHGAQTAPGSTPMRYSFLSVAHPAAHPAGHQDAAGPAELVAGEYRRGPGTRRIVRYALGDTGLPELDADGVARPVAEAVTGPPGMQGAVRVRDRDGGARWLAQTSRGPFRPGSLWRATDGEHLAADGAEQRWAVPMGCEDLSHWPADAPSGRDWLWSATEHPHRRWVYAVPAS